MIDTALFFLYEKKGEKVGKSLFQIGQEMQKEERAWTPSEEDKKEIQQAAAEAAKQTKKEQQKKKASSTKSTTSKQSSSQGGQTQKKAQKPLAQSSPKTRAEFDAMWASGKKQTNTKQTTPERNPWQGVSPEFGIWKKSGQKKEAKAQQSYLAPYQRFQSGFTRESQDNPEQYRWYLRNYGHGGIGGLEIMGANPKAGTMSAAAFNLRRREYGLPKDLLAVQDIDEWQDCIDLKTERVVKWDSINGICGREFDTFLEYIEDELDNIIENIGLEGEITILE